MVAVVGQLLTLLFAQAQGATAGHRLSSSLSDTLSTNRSPVLIVKIHKTGSHDGQRLPHKPLLVLLALGRWASGDHGPIPFAEVEKKLSALLQTYGPKGAGNPQEPFWRLRRDGVWELDGTGHLAAPDAVAPPGLKELRAGVTGRFNADVRQTLEADPTLVTRLARAVLDEHFPPSLQPDIADAVGLDLSATAPPTPTAKRKARDPEFRDRVLTAYGNRCALCGMIAHTTC
jgi:putative restriction endonuclease